MAAQQTDAEQAAMAARRIGSASPGCERVSEAARTPQGSACCEPVFATRRKPAFVAGGFGCFARVLESGAFSLLT